VCVYATLTPAVPCKVMWCDAMRCDALQCNAMRRKRNRETAQRAHGTLSVLAEMRSACIGRQLIATLLRRCMQRAELS
jgi:hypothetical protein